LKSPAPKIIEFYGLPGTGKTSVADLVIEDMLSKGCRVQGRQDYESWLKGLGVYSKAVIVTKILVSICLNINMLFKYILTTKPLKSINIKLLILILYKNFSLKEFKKNCDSEYILLDQFLMQDLWSLFVFSSLYSQKFIEFIVGKHANFDCIFFFRLPARKNAQRLYGRKGGTSRFDLSDYDDVLSLLIKKSRYTDEIYSFNGKCKVSYFVDASLDINKSKDAIIGKMYSYCAF